MLTQRLFGSAGLQKRQLLRHKPAKNCHFSQGYKDSFEPKNSRTRRFSGPVQVLCPELLKPSVFEAQTSLKIVTSRAQRHFQFSSKSCAFKGYQSNFEGALKTSVSEAPPAKKSVFVTSRAWRTNRGFVGSEKRHFSGSAGLKPGANQPKLSLLYKNRAFWTTWWRSSVKSRFSSVAKIEAQTS